jgi:hypothetical protein
MMTGAVLLRTLIPGTGGEYKEKDPDGNRRRAQQYTGMLWKGHGGLL